ncbi:hypothetical protein H6F67_06015 [Microcoleus sp. FACHB-1515]|uniref:hypothetical protein n=1 Tax=Cyanophyceae TaxID=3028117 RepID=UPI0016832804|nr:hypothetical protein [Microcoleus sp. FACHB-1515]MBD2089405.1 hypothetical protein [Microcoleus sp. FACHB-1515]
MSSLRSLLLLVIVCGLVLFVIQNWTPALPLVILGVPTQAIPLAFWMMGAIAAGAITTIAISALFRITAFTAAPRPSKRKGRSKPFPPDPDRGIDPRDVDPRDVPYGVADSPRTRIQSDDDWEPQPREVWDDWDAPVASSSREEQRYRSVEDRPPVDFRMRDREPDRVERIEYRFTDEDRSEEREGNFPEEEPEFYREPDPVPNFGNDEPPVYDAEYKVYRPAYRPLEEPDEPPYTEPAYSEPNYTEPDDREPEYRDPDYIEPDYRNEYPQPPYTEPEREVWDDWEEEPEPEPLAPPEPQRPIVEVQQTPKSQYRSGTVYSYSYRGEDDPKVDREPSEQNRPNEKSIDESKERMIVPPAPAADDDEDWGFDEDEDETDSLRRSNRDDW